MAEWDVVSESPSLAPSRPLRPRRTNPWEVVTEQPSPSPLSTASPKTSADFSLQEEQERAQKISSQPEWLQPIGRAADWLADTLTFGATKQFRRGVVRAPEDPAGAASDVIRSAATAIGPRVISRAIPGVVAGGRAAIGRAVGGLATGAALQTGVEEGAKSAGLSEGPSALLGDVAGAVSIGAAARGIRRLSPRRQTPSPPAPAPEVSTVNTPPAASAPVEKVISPAPSPSQITPERVEMDKKALAHLNKLVAMRRSEAWKDLSPEDQAVVREGIELVLERFPEQARKKVKRMAFKRAAMLDRGPNNPPPPEVQSTGDYVNWAEDQIQTQKDVNKPAGLVERAKEGWQRFRTGWVEDWSRPLDILNRVGKPDRGLGPSEQLRWQRGNAIRSENFAIKTMFDAGTQELPGGMNQEFFSKLSKLPPSPGNRKGTVVEFGHYLLGKRLKAAHDMNYVTGYESRMPFYEDLIARREKDFAPFERVVRRLEDIDLDYMVRSGLISADDIPAMKAIGEYVPLWRVMADDSLRTKILDTTRREGLGSLRMQTIVKELEGADKEIENPIRSLWQRHKQIYKEGEINKTARLLADFAGVSGGKAKKRPPIAPGFEGKLVPANEIQLGRPNVVAWYEGGKRMAMEVDPVIAAAAKNLESVEFGNFAKLYRELTRASKVGFTGTSFGFNVVVNMLRDVLHASVASEQKALPAKLGGYARAIGAAFRQAKSPVYRELEGRGVTGNQFDAFRGRPDINIERLSTPKRQYYSQLKNASKIWGDTMRALENRLSLGEEATRVWVWQETNKAKLAQGWSKEEAARFADLQARELTGDFLSGGIYSKAWNGFFIYLNAAMQSKRPLFRAIQDRPLETGAKFAAFIGVPVALATALNLRNQPEIYSDLHDEDKNNNIILITPWAHKDPKSQRYVGVLKAPLPPDMAYLGAEIRRRVEQLHGTDQPSFGETIKSLASFFSPLDLTVGSMVPHPVKPVYEAAYNINSYTGKPISYRPKLSQQFDARTPETLRLTAEVADKLVPSWAPGGEVLRSPKRTQHLLKGYFGPLPETLLTVTGTERLVRSMRPPRPDYVGPRDPAEQVAQRLFSASTGGRIRRLRERQEQKRKGLE